MICILITAREAGAALSMAPLWKHLRKRNDIDLKVFSQSPATEIFRDQQIPTSPLPWPVIDATHEEFLESEEALALLSLAEQLLFNEKPDVVIAGLSTPGQAGVDEAVIKIARDLAEASSHDLPKSFLIQDFWGDANLAFGAHPDHYLVMDEYARQLTKERHQQESTVVGSIRHAVYGDIPWAEEREKVRSAHGMTERDIVHGFFDQPLGGFEGYFKTIEHWAKTVTALGHPRVVFRDHPSSSPQHKKRVDALFAEGPHRLITKDLTVEEELLLCSTATSVLSNTNMDLSYINHFSSVPVARPIYALWEPDLKESLDKICNVKDLPNVQLKCAEAIEESLALVDQLAAFDGNTQVSLKQTWKNSKALPSPMQSLERLEKLIRTHK